MAATTLDNIPSSSQSTAPTPVDAKQTASLADHADPTWIVQQTGFAIGAAVVEKQIEQTPESLFAIYRIE